MKYSSKIRIKKFNVLALLGTLAGFLLAFSQPEQDQSPEVSSLFQAFEDAFMIGTALDRAHIYADAPEATERIVRVDRRGYYVKQQIIPDPVGLDLALTHFNVITPENVMKWEEIHPEPGVYDFDAADRLVALAQKHNKTIVAHTLVWHSQTPDWVFLDENGHDLSREALLERMRDHIHTVVGRYKGKIYGWDVVNEAFNEDGSYRESRWYKIIGEDYLSKAFEYAHEADPDAQLYYNDYNMENPSKRAGILVFVREMLDAGVPINGIGSQSHFSLMNFPDLEQIEKSITDFAELGIDVMITELDVNVLPSAWQDGRLNQISDIYRDGLPDEIQNEFTQRHIELFELYLRHSDVISRVTFWGVADGGSWLNYLPVERVNYPLLFDRDNRPKPAFHALIELAETYYPAE